MDAKSTKWMQKESEMYKKDKKDSSKGKSACPDPDPDQDSIDWDNSEDSFLEGKIRNFNLIIEK